MPPETFTAEFTSDQTNIQTNILEYKIERSVELDSGSVCIWLTTLTQDKVREILESCRSSSRIFIALVEH